MHFSMYVREAILCNAMMYLKVIVLNEMEWVGSRIKCIVVRLNPKNNMLFVRSGHVADARGSVLMYQFLTMHVMYEMNAMHVIYL